MTSVNQWAYTQVCSWKIIKSFLNINSFTFHSPPIRFNQYILQNNLHCWLSPVTPRCKYLSGEARHLELRSSSVLDPIYCLEHMLNICKTWGREIKENKSTFLRYLLLHLKAALLRSEIWDSPTTLHLSIFYYKIFFTYLANWAFKQHSELYHWSCFMPRYVQTECTMS